MHKLLHCSLSCVHASDAGVAKVVHGMKLVPCLQMRKRLYHLKPRLMRTPQKRSVRRLSSSSQLVHSQHLHRRRLLVILFNLLSDDVIASLMWPDLKFDTNNA